MAKTFLQLITNIKTEARIKSGSDLDDWLKSVINEEYQLLCQNSEYPELLVPNAVLAIAADEQSEFILPVGTRKVVSVEYALDGGAPAWRPLEKRNGHDVSYTQGTPKWFYRAGTKVFIYPYSLVATSSLLRVTYYKLPTELVADGDLMEIPSLEPVVVKKVIARALRIHAARAEASDQDVSAEKDENRVVQ